MNILEKAKKLAIEWHGDQKYGVHPYQKHLQDVVNVGKSFNLDTNVLAACWLHDVIEDCGVKYATIKREFNEEIAEMVYCVTDELGRNRKERKRKTYPKLAKNEGAIQVKLCDRIANVTQSLKDEKEGLLKMYKEEYQDFKQYLYRTPSDKTQQLWDTLESLVE